MVSSTHTQPVQEGAFAPFLSFEKNPTSQNYGEVVILDGIPVLVSYMHEMIGTADSYSLQNQPATVTIVDEESGEEVEVPANPVDYLNFVHGTSTPETNTDDDDE